MRWLLAGAIIALGALAGCTDDLRPPPPFDTGPLPADTSPADTSPADTSPADTSNGADASDAGAEAGQG